MNGNNVVTRNGGVFWDYRLCTAPEKRKGNGHRWQRRSIPVLTRKRIPLVMA